MNKLVIFWFSNFILSTLYYLTFNKGQIFLVSTTVRFYDKMINFFFTLYFYFNVSIFVVIIQFSVESFRGIVACGA